MKEYRVIAQSDQTFWSGGFHVEHMEKALNDLATKGWEVVSISSVRLTGFIKGPKDELVIVLVRDALP